MTKEVLFPLPDKLRIPHFGHSIIRHISTNVYRFLAPAEIEEYKDTIGQTNELINKGYALLVLGLHFTKREGFDFITRPVDLVNHIYGLPVVMPVAFHQYVDNEIVLELLTKLNAVTAVPVVNTDTVEKGLNKVPGTDEVLPSGYGFPAYVHLMIDLIDHHGISGIAAQAGRRKSLEIEQAKQRTLETLLVAIAREKEKERRRTQPDSARIARIRREQMIRQFKIAIMLMPIRPMYKADYEKIYEKYQLFKKNHIQIGPVFTIDELYRVRDQANKLLKVRFNEAKVWYEKKRQVDKETEDPTLRMKDNVTLDEVVLTILSFGADPNYNRISREEGWTQAIVEAIDLIEAVRDLI